MKRSIKLWFTVSLVLIVAGVALIGATHALGAGFERAEYLTTIIPIEESFEHIQIETTDANVSILPATDGQVKLIVVEEKDKLSYEAIVTDETLIVTQNDRRTWIDFVGIRFSRPQISLYLPTTWDWGNLEISTTGGNVSLTAYDVQLCFDRTTVQTVSGNIDLGIARVSSELKFKTTSGNIRSAYTAANHITIQTTSGNITLSDLVADFLQCNNASGKTEWIRIETAESAVSSQSGNIELINASTETLSAKSISGNIRLEDCFSQKGLIETTGGNIDLERHNAEDLTLISTSGNITASLFHAMQYELSSVSGKMISPTSNPSGGTCRCRTKSGNIRIEES